MSDAPAFNDPSQAHPVRDRAGGRARPERDDAGRAGRRRRLHRSQRHRATLLVGLSGGTLTPLGAAVTTVAAVAADNCPTGLGFVARFAGVTLPDSIENTNGSLATPTELRVRVADAVNPSSIGTSVAVDLWVDPIAPVLTLATPANLCGSFQQSSTTVTQAVTFNAENGSVVLQVTNGATTDTYTNPAFASGVATFAGGGLRSGPERRHRDRERSRRQRDDAGAGSVQRDHRLRAGRHVQRRRPRARSCARSARRRPAASRTPTRARAGWQGTLTVHVTGDGQPITSGTVTFTVGTTTLGHGGARRERQRHAQRRHAARRARSRSSRPPTTSRTAAWAPAASR